MGNLDFELKNKWPYKFTLSEIQCAAGIRLLKKLINLTLYGFKGQKSD